MNELEVKFNKKKNHLRRRRNLIRKILLLTFVLLFVCAGYYIIGFANSQKVSVKIQHASLVDVQKIEKNIYGSIVGKNFFSISPHEISSKLKSGNKLFNEVVVRKYLFPSPVLLVYLSEKYIWANLSRIESSSSELISFITDDAELVDPIFYLNKEALVQKTSKIYLVSKFDLDKGKLSLLKNFTTLLNTEKIKYKSIYIDRGHHLRVILSDDVSVKFGMLNESILNKVFNLKEALAVADSSMYHVNAFDLSLDSSAVLKYKDEKTNTDKVINTSSKDFFGRAN